MKVSTLGRGPGLELGLGRGLRSGLGLGPGLAWPGLTRAFVCLGLSFGQTCLSETLGEHHKPNVCLQYHERLQR